MTAMPPIVSTPAQTSTCDLFVDLDGTLIAADVAGESLVRAGREVSALLGAIRAYATGGLAGMKRDLAETTPPDVATLPYRAEVLDYIRAARAEGRRIVLATAADKTVADAVAAHLGLFDAVIASEPGQNLKGVEKLRAIKDMADGPFEYLGDSDADVPIWQAAAHAGFVSPSARAKRQMAQTPDTVSLYVARPMSPLVALCKAMRPHQWAKNVLVFVPMVFAHEYAVWSVSLAAVLAFICFSLCASAVYLINDIFDIEADRKHATKRNRPFAAGHLSILRGLLVAAVLLCTALIAAVVLVNRLFTAVLLTYVVFTTAYTVGLKKYSTVDVVALSLLYTVRILAGAAATDLVPSPWLLTYSLFFFLSLAYMKRYIELSRLPDTIDNAKLPSRNYYASEDQLVLTFGISNGALSVLTLAQYVNSPAVAVYYASPFLLWLIVPVMMFWTYRSWTWASRGRIGDDPVVFALRDRISQTCAGVILLIIFVARTVETHWGSM
jgi:4-hydroxybenzoate polyprenyltransferase